MSRPGPTIESVRHFSARLRVAALLLCAAAVAGCATMRPQSSALSEAPVTAEMMLSRSPLGTPGQRPETTVDEILHLTPEMTAFVDQNVDSDLNEFARLRQLVLAIMGSDRFTLLYDETTRTARETFEQRLGNCLSFTNLFVAMARYSGIEASYQEVEIPPDWSLAGQSFLLSKHVNVFVRLSHGETRIVDFNIYDFSTTYERHVISDERARAHYFNNIGAERMLNGETSGALANFRASLGHDARFSPAWINLGVLYRREGLPAYAEAAFMAALDIESNNLVAMSNLASLYEEQGNTALAETYREEVRTHRMRNPFYRFHLANVAFGSGDYADAIDHLKYAIRRHEDEPRFYALLSMSYLMTGEREAAQRWMQQAEAASVRSNDQEKYAHKLKWLMQQP